MHILSRENSTVYHYFNTVYPEFYKFNVVEVLHSNTIKWCINNNFRYYDLGGTGSGFDEGNLKFKKQFSEVIPNLAWDRGGLNFIQFFLNKSISMIYSLHTINNIRYNDFISFNGEIRAYF